MIFQLFRYKFVCDDCQEFSYFDGKDDARLFGWSVSHFRFSSMDTGRNLNGYKCWCPNCSVNHKRGRPRKAPPSSNS